MFLQCRKQLYEPITNSYNIPQFETYWLEKKWRETPVIVLWNDKQVQHTETEITEMKVVKLFQIHPCIYLIVLLRERKTNVISIFKKI